MNQYNSIKLAYVQGSIGLVSLMHCIYYFPFRQFKHAPFTWTRIQWIHCVTSLCVVLQQIVILIEAGLHFSYLYSCTWLETTPEYLILSRESCTRLSLDVRQETVYNPLLKFAILPLFTTAGSSMIFYAAQKYQSMMLPASIPSSEVSSKSSSSSNFRLFLTMHRFHAVCALGTVLGWWVMISCFMSDLEDPVAANGARISRIAATLVYCLYIIGCVGLTELRLIYVVLHEVSGGYHGKLTHPSASLSKSTPKSQTTSSPTRPTTDSAQISIPVIDPLHKKPSEASDITRPGCCSLRRFSRNYMKFLEHVSFWERFKLFFITTSTLLAGTFILGMHIWAEVFHPSRKAMNYYAPIGLSVASMLFNQILAAMAILHKSLLKIREATTESARLAAGAAVGRANILSHLSASKSSGAVLSQSRRSMGYAPSQVRASHQLAPLQTTFSAILD